MKKLMLYIFFFFFLGSSLLSAQEQPPYPTYFFEGNEVVFEFDLRCFREAQPAATPFLDFKGMGVYEAIVQGAVDSWSQQSWRLEKTGPKRYQLRKPIDAFDDGFPWLLKYIINGEYWTDPFKAVKAKPETTQPAELWEQAYNEDLHTVHPSPEGNVYFFLPGHETAEEVLLTGEFTSWSERRFAMRRVNDGWELQLHLPAGRYEYKFIVDGEWMHDPENPHTVRNQYQTLNSVYEVKKETRFKLAGYEGADEVLLAGSFTNWAENALRMHREGDAWVTRLPLTGGKHLYKFIVDGKWIIDPENPLREYDWQGNMNSVRMVE